MAKKFECPVHFCNWFVVDRENSHIEFDGKRVAGYLTISSDGVAKDTAIASDDVVPLTLELLSLLPDEVREQQPLNDAIRGLEKHNGDVTLLQEAYELYVSSAGPTDTVATLEEFNSVAWIRNQWVRAVKKAKEMYGG